MARAEGSPTISDEADSAAAAGDFARALRLLEQAIEREQGSIELWMKLSAMRRAAGDLGGALQSVEKALALAPLDFSGLLSRAVLLERLGDLSAGEAFNRALAQLPPDGRIPPAMNKAVEPARRKAAEHQAAVESR